MAQKRHTTAFSLLVAAVLMGVVGADPARAADPPAGAGEGFGARAAFAMLSNLAGDWVGTAGGEGEEGQATAAAWRVTSGGHTVMETQFPGTGHEMISMYYLDGEDLALKHFCAVGNQPEMRLDPKASSSQRLVFTFTGGSNLDPAVDGHIHGGVIDLEGPDTMHAAWSFYREGKEEGKNVFTLARKKP